MSVPLVSFSDAANLLPQEKKEVIASNKKKAVEKYTKMDSEQKNHSFILPLVLGIIAALVGTYLVLAAHQILPSSINFIPPTHQLSAWIGGYVAIGLGLVGLIICSVLAARKPEPHGDGGVSTEYNSTISEIDSYLPWRLKEGELFAMDDPKQKEISVYGYRTGLQKVKYDTNPEEALKKWSESHADKKFVTLETVTNRAQQFERDKEAKALLDSLVASQGTMESLPTFPQNLKKYPVLKEMDHLVMRGCFENPRDEKDKRLFLAIVLQCMSTKEELKALLRPRDHSVIDYLDLSKPTNGLLILYQDVADASSWKQVITSEIMEPNFFKSYFIGNGKLNEPKTFEDLKRAINTDEEVVDLIGVRWKLGRLT